jgi:hypothetical protein
MTFTEIEKLYIEALTEKQSKKISSLENKLKKQELEHSKEMSRYKDRYISLHEQHAIALKRLREIDKEH